MGFGKNSLNKLIIGAVFCIFFVAACADSTRQHISLPPVAESPSKETIFGEATIDSSADLKKPIEAAVIDTGRPLSLEQCIELAKKVNPAMDSADQAYVGAMWTRWQSITDFLPKASASYSLTQYDNRRDAAIGQSDGRTGRSLQFQVAQPLFTGGANLTNYLLSQLGISSAEIDKAVAKDDLILTVKQVYYQILTLQKALEVAKTSVVNLRSHLNVAQNFYDVGMVPRNQVLEAEVELAKAIQEETSLTHNLVSAKTNLNILLRQPLQSPIRIIDSLKYTPFPLSMNECIGAGLNDRPEMRLGRNQVDMAAKGIDLARSGFYPTVSMVYTNYDNSGSYNTLNGGDLGDPSGWNIAALANFNFWEWGKTKAEVEKGKVNLNRAINSLTSLEDSTKLEITQNYQNLLSAGKNIGVAEKAIIAAAEDLRMVNERYQEQVATNTEVLDAQTRYSEAHYEYYQALYNYNLSWANLERVIGRQVR